MQNYIMKFQGKVTLLLIVITALVFVAQTAIPQLTNNLALTPSKAVSGQPWQFVTYMFLHADELHIFLNMFALVIFGFMVEGMLGTRKYLILYFASGIGASIVYLLLTYSTTPAFLLQRELATPMLGASGAVFGVLAAYGLLLPRQWIIMFPGIPMPAIVAVFVFAGIEIFYGLTGLQAGVANFGHLGGLIFGGLLTYYWKKKEAKPELLIKNHEEKDWDYVWNYTLFFLGKEKPYNPT